MFCAHRRQKGTQKQRRNGRSAIKSEVTRNVTSLEMIAMRSTAISRSNQLNSFDESPADIDLCVFHLFGVPRPVTAFTGAIAVVMRGPKRPARTDSHSTTEEKT